MASIYICESCRVELRPDDSVVAAAEQVEASSQGEATRQYVDGVRSLFHERHWKGDTVRFKERARGPLSSLVAP